MLISEDFLYQLFKLCFGHQYLTGLGTLFFTDDTDLRQLIHKPGGAVKADLKDSLQHTDRCFVLFDNKASRICKVGIIFRSG